jgi:predicted PurR-regulated permease PerM
VGDTVNNLPDTVVILGFEVPLSGLTQQFEQNYEEFTFVPTLAEILNYFQQLISTATTLLSSTATIGLTVVGSIVQVVVTFLIIFFLSLYLTKDAPSIRAYIEGLVPRSYQSEWIDLLRRMGEIWQAFFRGQILLAIIIGMITWLALELAGMPGALLLGILAGSLEIIPTLGPILAMIPAVIIALIQGSTVLADYGINNFGFALITIAIYFIIQQLENNILVPRIIGGGVNLHPVVVICGVAVGFNLFGILGALFAAPVIASLRVLGGYIHAKLLDYPPFHYRGATVQARRGPVVYRRTVTGEELAVRAAARATPSAPVAADDSDLMAETREEEYSSPETNPGAGGAPVRPAARTNVDEEPARVASDIARQEVGSPPGDRPGSAVEG